MRALEGEVSAARARLSAQAATVADVAQTEARVAAARAEVDKADAQAERAKRASKRSSDTGRDLPEPTDLGSTLLLPQTLEQALAAAQDENPQVLAAVKAEAAASHNIDAVRANSCRKCRSRGRGPKRMIRVGRRQDRRDLCCRPRADAALRRWRYVRAGASGERTALGRNSRRAGASRAGADECHFRMVASQVSPAQQGSTRLRLEAARKALSGLRSELQIGARSVIDVLNAQQEVIDAEIADRGRQTRKSGCDLRSAGGHRRSHDRASRSRRDRL